MSENPVTPFRAPNPRYGSPDWGRASKRYGYFGSRLPTGGQTRHEILSLSATLVAVAGCYTFAPGRQSYGPKIYPAAMSMDYNPLLWQGDDAQFALDVIHSTHCTAEMSKTVAAQTQNPVIQTVAATIAHEQGKLYRQLRNMARTLRQVGPLPSSSSSPDR